MESCINGDNFSCSFNRPEQTLAWLAGEEKKKKKRKKTQKHPPPQQSALQADKKSWNLKLWFIYMNGKRLEP